MIRVFCESRDMRLPNATADGDALWLDCPDVERATGWAWKPEGLCRDDACMPLPRKSDKPIVDGDRLDVAAFWRHAGWPVVHDDTSQLWVLGQGAERRADALSSLQAPDFDRPRPGHTHRLYDYRDERFFLRPGRHGEGVGPTSQDSV